MEEQIGFLFLVFQLGRSLLNETLQVVGVPLQLLQHRVDDVDLSVRLNADKGSLET